MDDEGFRRSRFRFGARLRDVDAKLMKKLTFAVVLASSTTLCAADQGEAFSMLQPEPKIGVILHCVSALGERVPSLTDGDRVNGYSKLEVGNSSLHRNAVVNFHYDGCPLRPYNPNLPDDCASSTMILCSVDLETNKIERLLAPDGPDPYHRVDHVEFSDDGDAKLREELKEKANNREVAVWAFTTFEYFYDYWAELGEVRVEGQLISDFIETVDE